LIYDQNNENKKEFESITLDTDDIYKELRIRGYDYGPKFRGIKELRIEDSRKIYGDIEWTGNMIPFMDSLIQSQAIALPFRKIFIPVMISSLRCDPKKFFDAIEERKQLIHKENDSGDKILDVMDTELDMGISNENEYKKELKKAIEEEVRFFDGVVGDIELKYKSILPFFADISLKIIVTHGIEINGLLAVPIPRKAFAQGLELESYQFIPNEENDAIEQIHKKDITEYIQGLFYTRIKSDENFRNG
jgi:hypothetical protein